MLVSILVGIPSFTFLWPLTCRILSAGATAMASICAPKSVISTFLSIAVLRITALISVVAHFCCRQARAGATALPRRFRIASKSRVMVPSPISTFPFSTCSTVAVSARATAATLPVRVDHHFLTELIEHVESHSRLNLFSLLQKFIMTRFMRLFAGPFQWASSTQVAFEDANPYLACSSDSQEGFCGSLTCVFFPSYYFWGGCQKSRFFVSATVALP